MWHTDALDTFDDNLGYTSRFLNARNHSSNGLNQSGDVWITSITICQWRLEDDFDKEMRDHIEKSTVDGEALKLGSTAKTGSYQVGTDN